MANDFIRESDLDKIKKMTLFDAILFRKACGFCSASDTCTRF